MTDLTAALSEKLEAASKEVEELLSIPSELIAKMEEELSDIKRQQQTVNHSITAVEKEISDSKSISYSSSGVTDQENRAPDIGSLSEEECAKLLPVLSKLTLSEAVGELGRLKVMIGKFTCQPDFVDKNWEFVTEAINRIN